MIKSIYDLIAQKKGLKGHPFNLTYFKTICKQINQKRGYVVQSVSDMATGAPFFHCEFSRNSDSRTFFILCRPPLVASCSITRLQYRHYCEEGFEGLERGPKDFINEAHFYNDRKLKDLLADGLLLLDADFLKQRIGFEQLTVFKKLRLHKSFDEMVSFWRPRQISELIFNWWED